MTEQTTNNGTPPKSFYEEQKKKAAENIKESHAPAQVKSPIPTEAIQKAKEAIKENEIKDNGFAEKFAGTISGEKINKLVQIMVLMGQKGAFRAQQAFENEVALDRLHTISYDIDKGIGRILDVNESWEFKDDEFYDFKEVRGVLEKYFFTLDYANV